MRDIFERLKSVDGPLEQYRRKAEGYFMFPELEGEIAPRMKFHGKEVITWSLNNYLGLANHPEVRKADAEAAAQWGMAYPMGARMMSGQTKYHRELEERLAKFEKKESAYLLNYGYQGMVSIIDSLCTRCLLLLLPPLYFLSREWVHSSRDAAPRGRRIRLQ